MNNSKHYLEHLAENQSHQVDQHDSHSHKSTDFVVNTGHTSSPRIHYSIQPVPNFTTEYEEAYRGFAPKVVIRTVIY